MIDKVKKPATKPPAGKVHLSIYVATDMRKQLRLLAVEEDRKITEIVEGFILDGLAAKRKR